MKLLKNRSTLIAFSAKNYFSKSDHLGHQMEYNLVKLRYNEGHQDIITLYSLPQSRSFVYLLPLLPDSPTSVRLCQLPDVSEGSPCVSKDIVSLKATFTTTGSHKILHIGQ